ncbi:glycosyl transferase family 2 [Methylophaga sp. 41_12_T18]|nr:glycosyl transferase family 2 [Methylophaga sp. 41_12_T18]
MTIGIGIGIGIVIVNYRTALLTIECLRSLSWEHKEGSFNIIVVDNDSQDESFETLCSAVISEGWSDWVDIKTSGHNGGFSYGNNFAIREFMAKKYPPEFIYLLNPDTYTLDSAVSKLSAFMMRNKNVGITGGRIEDTEGEPQYSSFQFHTFWTELNRGFGLNLLSKVLRPWVKPLRIPEVSEKTDWVSGASMMIRRTVIEQIGLLDESYFMYFEETDFCLQATRAGWECWYVPESRVVHYVGQSSGVTNTKMTKRLPTYWFDSRRRYFLKNHGVLHALVADLFWLSGFSSWKLRNLVQGKQDNNPPKLLQDSFRNSVFCRGFKLTTKKE